ncbi:MAG: hypothetical protein Q4C29_02670 [bacterium]|nr:hypothetical protein [bacterium]
MKKEVIFRFFRIFLVILFFFVLSYFRNNIMTSYEIRDDLDKSVEVSYFTYDTNYNKSPCSDEEGMKGAGYRIGISNSDDKERSISFILDELKYDYSYGYEYLKYQILKNDKALFTDNISENLVLYNTLLDGNSYDIYEIKFWVSENAPKSVLGKNFSFKVTLI